MQREGRSRSRRRDDRQDRDDRARGDKDGERGDRRDDRRDDRGRGDDRGDRGGDRGGDRRDREREGKGDRERRSRSRGDRRDRDRKSRSRGGRDDKDKERETRKRGGWDDTRSDAIANAMPQVQNLASAAAAASAGIFGGPGGKPKSHEELLAKKNLLDAQFVAKAAAEAPRPMPMLHRSIAAGSARMGVGLGLSLRPPGAGLLGGGITPSPMTGVGGLPAPQALVGSGAVVLPPGAGVSVPPPQANTTVAPPADGGWKTGDAWSQPPATVAAPAPAKDTAGAMPSLNFELPPLSLNLPSFELPKMPSLEAAGSVLAAPASGFAAPPGVGGKGLDLGDLSEFVSPALAALMGGSA